MSLKNEPALLSIAPQPSFPFFCTLQWVSIFYISAFFYWIVVILLRSFHSPHSAIFTLLTDKPTSYYVLHPLGILISVAVLSIPLAIIVFLWATKMHATYKYSFTKEQGVLSYGFLQPKTHFVKYAAIRNIKIKASLIEHLLHLNSVYIDGFNTVLEEDNRLSCGNECYSVTRLEGLSLEDAERILKIVNEHRKMG